MLLELKGVRAGYGETVVLDGVSLALEEGGNVAVLGRNGVGKTTLLATVMGHTTLHKGSIHFSGTDITRATIYGRARSGIGYVPQEREIFPSLSVDENLTVAARPGKWTLERVFDLFPNLGNRRRNMGNQLSGGEQQMLAVARALMLRPRLLLLDEPSLGLAPLIVREIFRIVRTINRDEHVSVLLVEQNASVALGLADHAYLMETGRVVMSGPAAELRQNDAIRRAYLGY